MAMQDVLPIDDATSKNMILFHVTAVCKVSYEVKAVFYGSSHMVNRM